MLAAASDTATTAIVLLSVIGGPLAAGAIYWFGLRSARRHDEETKG